ncbi:MAG: hypothetical protein DMF70_07615 [Acidobacteria bacterium]|nr:MAG: hypothetical protein DMF70_07615 [Acidobacteriota bacterium]
MKRFFAVAISLLVLASFVVAQERRFTIDDLLKVRRVGDPQVSPKGDLVAFTITDVDKVANKSTTQIYLVPLGGGEVRQLTNDEHSSASPRWSPDGEKLAFISARDGEDQIWTIDVSAVRSGLPTANCWRLPPTFIRNARTTRATNAKPKRRRKAK